MPSILTEKKEVIGSFSFCNLQRGHKSMLLFRIPLQTKTDLDAMQFWMAIQAKSSTLGGQIFFQIAYSFDFLKIFIFPSWIGRPYRLYNASFFCFHKLYPDPYRVSLDTIAIVNIQLKIVKPNIKPTSYTYTSNKIQLKISSPLRLLTPLVSY